jgi:hypothetical protein
MLKLQVDTHKIINGLDDQLRERIANEKYYLDEKKIRRVRTILGAVIAVALNLVVFRKEILKSLKKSSVQDWCSAPVQPRNLL